MKISEKIVVGEKFIGKQKKNKKKGKKTLW